MKRTLSLGSTLSHDGDGVVRFSIGVMSDAFSGSTMVWGNEEEPTSLADLLSGFPKFIGDAVHYRFGSTRSGTCDLNLCSLNGSGHTGVWVHLVAPYVSGGGDMFQSSTLFIRAEPSAIDRFCAALRAFTPGEENAAVLAGIEEF
jgi:hypothetical protein